MGLQLLDDCYHESLDEKEKHTRKAKIPSMVQYMELVKKIRAEFYLDVLGKEKDGAFDGSVNQIRQSFMNKMSIHLLKKRQPCCLIYSGKEPCFCRWEQTHCCCLLSVVLGAKWTT